MYVQDTITKGRLVVQSRAFAATNTTVLTRRTKRSRAWASPTTSSPATRFFAFPTREHSKHRSTRTWCFPASDAPAVLNPLLLCSSSSLTPLSPGFRNEFHAGLQQAFGKHLVFDGEYIWKYTHNAYDFSVLGNTPITFPIEWDSSKIPGFTVARQRARISTA